MATATINLENRDEALLLFGSRDVYLRMIKDTLGVRLVARGDTIQIEGEEDAVQRAERAFQQLRQQLRHQNQLSPENVRSILDIVQQGGERVSPQNLTVQNMGRFVRPRSD
ncbi:MAG TPA: PhoH family protein, partial [Gemmataceae bacterium]|nr:PhoH family protein [Gemmataceae bacterium]